MSVVENLVKWFGSGVCVFTHIKLGGGLNGYFSAGERDMQKVPSVFLT